MKTLPPDLLAHYRSAVLRTALLYRVVRVDNAVLTLTSHDAEISFGGELYSPANAASPSAIATGSEMAADTTELSGSGSGGVLPAGTISLKDQLSGRYDGATVTITRVCYEHPEWGGELLRRGTLGQLSAGPTSFKIDVRGMLDALQKEVGVVLQPGCRADLGDLVCGVDLHTYTHTATVTSVDSLRSFSCAELTQDAGEFNGGRLLFLSGANAGLKFEVKASTAGGGLVLHTDTPDPIAPGDNISVHLGCDHTMATCRDRFQNLRRYSGEPCVNTDRNLNSQV